MSSSSVSKSTETQEEKRGWPRYQRGRGVSLSFYQDGIESIRIECQGVGVIVRRKAENSRNNSQNKAGTSLPREIAIISDATGKESPLDLPCALP